MRRVWTLLVLALALTACGGTQIPQHGGYKAKKGKPWEKAKEIKLKDGELTGKVSTDLDYGAYKRARWFYVNLPGPGELAIDMEVVPGGGSDAGDDEEGEDMDVAIELLDASYNVIAKSDLETEEENRLKKSIGKKQLRAGKHLVHLYLQGRLDSAEVELKLKFTKGDEVWESDFPVRVAYAPEVAAVPVFDDTPTKPTPKPPTGRPRPRPVTPTPTTPKPTTGGRQAVQVGITDTQADGAGGVRIVIGGGLSDGLANGDPGQVVGVKNGKFTLSGCAANTCKAVVKANLDDVRNSGNVTVLIRPAAP